MLVHEIFDSLSGEIDGFGGQGKPTTFIRLQGCNLPRGCAYCDSKETHQSFNRGRELTLAAVMSYVTMPKVIITGGEPLVQYNDVVELVRLFSALITPVTIETNGSIVVPHNFIGPNYYVARKAYLRIVMDYKLPRSGMEDYMEPAAFMELYPWDVIKFVIDGDVDYARMKELLSNNMWRAQIVISPSFGGMEDLPSAQVLAQKMLDDPDLRNAQFSLQMHKLLGVK
ncbi:hypothetical protein LCGC14_2395250 [marine sediment metagenome]|uniref:Radical SAM core domain-containing protein n=1 Tax=marine sediment metagenome TaxID=412755 RepID=A0A0F9CJ15_9ZZZZ